MLCKYDFMQRKKDTKIDPQKPWDGDKLERKETGEYFSRLISNIRDPYVISLKSPFGTGKTDFLKRFKCHLEMENTGCKIFYWKVPAGCFNERK